MPTKNTSSARGRDDLLRKPRADKRVKAWAISAPSASLFISAITVLELETGVLRLERHDKRQGAALRRWLALPECF